MKIQKKQKERGGRGGGGCQSKKFDGRKTEFLV